MNQSTRFFDGAKDECGADDDYAAFQEMLRQERDDESFIGPTDEQIAEMMADAPHDTDGYTDAELDALEAEYLARHAA